MNCVHETGRNGNAPLFFQLEMILQRLRPGQRALGMANESSKWLKAGRALERV